MSHFKLYFVDLDGTLIFTDLGFYSFLLYLKKNPLGIFCVAWWIWRGRCYVKHQLAKRIPIDLRTIRQNPSAVEYFKKLKTQGNRLVLATGSNRIYAEQVAEFFGFFDGVLASSETINFIGSKKVEAFQKFAGTEPFVYAGNSRVDLKIWPHCAGAIVVNASASVRNKAARISNVIAVL